MCRTTSRFVQVRLVVTTGPRTSTGTKLVRWQLEKTFIGHVMWVSFYLSFQTMICSAFNLGFQTVWNHGSKQLLKCRTICKTSSTTKRHLRHFLIEIASCLNKHVGGQPDHCMAAEIDLEIRFPAGFQHKLIQLSFFCSYVAGSLSRKHTFRQEYLASATDGCPRNPGLLEISMSLEAFWISLSLSPSCLLILLACPAFGMQGRPSPPALCSALPIARLHPQKTSTEALLHPLPTTV